MVSPSKGAAPPPGQAGWRWLKEWGQLCLVAGVVAWRLLDGSPGSLAGQRPDFTLPEIGPDGGSLTLSSLAGKVRVVDFWATWCGPCKLMTPVYSDLYRRYRDRGLAVVGVALDDPVAVARFVADHHVPYRIVIGDERTEREFGGIRGIPTTFILDRQGQIVQKDVGYRPEFLLDHDIVPLLSDIAQRG